MRTWLRTARRGVPVALIVILVLSQVFLFSLPARAAGVTDFFTINYSINLSNSEVTEGQSFTAICSGSAVCITTVPITQATITSRVEAQSGSGPVIILNPGYSVIISPFPNTAGQTTAISQSVPLSFPAGSALGTYTVTAKLLDASVQTGLGPISVTSFLPASKAMGSVQLKQASAPPSGGGGGGGGGGSPPPSSTPTPTPAIPVANPREPVTVLLSGIVNTDSGVCMSPFTAKSNDAKCQIGLATGSKIYDQHSGALTELTITPVLNPPTTAGINIIGMPYELGPSGAYFDPSVTLTFAYTKPDNVNESDLRLGLWDPAAKQFVVVEGAKFVNGIMTVEITHFSMYTVLAVTPAKFSIKDLKVTPAQPLPAQDITISATVNNTGGSTGDYSVTLKVDGAEVSTKPVKLEAGAASPVSFTVKGVSGNHTVDVNGLTANYRIPTPAKFEVTVTPTFHVTRPIIYHDFEAIPFEATIANTGETDGVYDAVFKVNNILVEQRKILVPAKSEVPAIFNFTHQFGSGSSANISLGSDLAITLNLIYQPSNPYLPIQPTLAPVTPSPVPIDDSEPSSPLKWILPVGALVLLVVVGTVVIFVHRHDKKQE